MYSIDKTIKEINKKFALKNFFKIYIAITIFMCFITSIHELLHVIPGAIMGYDMKIAIGFPTGGITWTKEEKNYLINWIIALISCVMIYSCGFDIINSYNTKNKK